MMHSQLISTRHRLSPFSLPAHIHTHKINKHFTFEESKRKEEIFFKNVIQLHPPAREREISIQKNQREIISKTIN